MAVEMQSPWRSLDKTGESPPGAVRSRSPSRVTTEVKNKSEAEVKDPQPEAEEEKEKRAAEIDTTVPGISTWIPRSSSAFS